MFERAKLLIACAVLGLGGGCLTPEMAREIDDSLGLTPRLAVPSSERAAATAFDDDAALPARIWYADLATQIYHERRTNTFIAFDSVHRGWGAIPQEEAYERGFQPGRAKLLPAGPPEDVAKVIDYLTAMEPEWRGS